MSRNSWSGPIGSQSLAHTSAPKTTIPRSAMRLSRAGFEANPGKRKNGVAGVAADLSINRGLIRRDPAVDVRLGFRHGYAIEQGMRVTVVADAVALGQGSPGDLRMRRRISSKKEERRTHALILEGVQNFSEWSRARDHHRM